MRVNLLLLFSTVFAGNILVLNPNLGHSHVRFLGNLADLYAKDGHNVTILSPFMDENVGLYGTENPNITKIVYRSPYLQKNPWEKNLIKTPDFWSQEEPEGVSTDWSVWEAFMHTYFLVYRGLLEDKELINSLQASNFDVGVTELFELGSMGFFEVLGVKSTIIGAAVGIVENHYELTGLPQFISFVPIWMTTLSQRMSFYEKLQNMKVRFEIARHEEKDRAIFQNLFEEHYPNFMDLSEITKKRVGVILTNANEFTESPRLRTNMFQYVGGTNVHPPKPVNEEFNALLNLRSSTVLFSFGTFIKGCQMPSLLKREILEAFAAFPNVTFLWKHEDDCGNDTTFFGDYDNVILKSWMPQTDLLGDDRVKAFITHAGMNSLLESSFRGKPMITVPLFGDQYVNAKATREAGISLLIKRTELSRSTLVTALTEVLDPESSISKQARMAAAVLDGKGDEYRREALRWGRLLSDYGPMAHLRLASNDLNFIQLYSLDCYLFILSVSLLAVIFSYKLIRLILDLTSKLKSD